jgi:hypothetical protein
MEVRTAIRPSSLPAIPAAPDAPPPPRPGVRPSSGPGTREEIDRLVHLVEKATRAVHAAHDQGLIHRDVKPGNIMVTREGEPVILDFGLARDEDGTGASITQTGALMGTPAYMSPEQIAAQRIRLDRRTDVYSMGVTLYEALTLRLPFAASSRDSLYQKILVSDPENARKLNPAIPVDLKVVLDKSMEKDRERRYPTAEGFAEDLRRVRMREPIQARPASLATRIHRWVQRNPGVAVPVLGAAAMAVVLPPLALALVEKGRAAAKEEFQVGGSGAGPAGTTYSDPSLMVANDDLVDALKAKAAGNRARAREKAKSALDLSAGIPEGKRIHELAQRTLLELQD